MEVTTSSPIQGLQGHLFDVAIGKNGTASEETGALLQGLT